MNSLSKKPLGERELLLVSFFITDPRGLVKIEAQWKKRNLNHSNFLGRSREDTNSVTSKDLGGGIVLIDPNNLHLGFLAEIKISVPMGMYHHSREKTLYVASNYWIKKFSKGRIVETLNNKFFNNIHGITKSLGGNLLVSSTGIDALLEIDFDNPEKVIWDWFATEHGYNRTPAGELRCIDRAKNYQRVGTCTPEHTTHINSCLEIGSGKILATLFHQGELIEISRKSGKTKVVLSGLRAPHYIRKHQEGFIISDTLNGRVLLLNRAYGVIRKLESGYNWVQDAIGLSDGDIAIGDSNNGRLVKVDFQGRVIDELRWDKRKRKIGSFLTVTAGEAENIFSLGSVRY